jgi:ribosome-associated toxin RatA of RatAB toxin-antitoxin module
VAEVNQSALVEFTPTQMFSLVDSVEKYPDFLPWCGGATVIHRDASVTRATIRIHYRGIRQSFTTENIKRAPAEMQLRLVEGPFRSLEGKWRFTDLARRGCKIDLNLRYELSSRVLDKLIGPVFHHIASTLVEAFVKRAARVYSGKSVDSEQ